MRVSPKIMEIMLIKHFLQWFLHFFSPIFKFSENPGLIDFKFDVTHPGEGLYQSLGNYADAAILSAKRQGLLASCYGFLRKPFIFREVSCDFNRIQLR